MKSILAAVAAAVLVMGMVRLRASNYKRSRSTTRPAAAPRGRSSSPRRAATTRSTVSTSTLVFAGHPGRHRDGRQRPGADEQLQPRVGDAGQLRGDAPFTVVGSSLNKAFFALMSRKEFASVKDLKGKTIAVSQIGDPPYNYTSAFLRTFGLSARDVQWIAAGADATAGPPRCVGPRRRHAADAAGLLPARRGRLQDLGNLADHDESSRRRPTC